MFCNFLNEYKGQEIGLNSPNFVIVEHNTNSKALLAYIQQEFAILVGVFFNLEAYNRCSGFGRFHNV